MVVFDQALSMGWDFSCNSNLGPALTERMQGLENLPEKDNDDSSNKEYFSMIAWSILMQSLEFAASHGQSAQCVRQRTLRCRSPDGVGG